jgi:hypothetical protein
MPPLFLVALPVIIVVVIVIVIVVVVVVFVVIVIRLRIRLRLWLRIRCWRFRLRLWLGSRRRRLRSGRWAGVWPRRHIVTDQQGKPATAALRAFWGQRQDNTPIDVRGAGRQWQDQEKVFHFGSHRLLSAKCSCRLPSCASSVGLPFLRPMLAT